MVPVTERGRQKELFHKQSSTHGCSYPTQYITEPRVLYKSSVQTPNIKVIKIYCITIPAK